MQKQQNIKDMDFEINFYEALLQKKPDFIEALIALGELYTQRGLYEKGRQVDEKLSFYRPDDPIILYNLACSYSLLNQTNKAYRSIKKAINCGYHDYDHLEQDEDLFNLKRDPRFQKYFSRVLKKQ